MVLAHQYLGQLEPKLQEAFSANTAIKFAGGVSAKDARSLAPMLYTDPAFIEAQGKGSFASHIRGLTKHAVPLTFPFGYLEEQDVMSSANRAAQREAMRKRYAVHYSKIGEAEEGEKVEVADEDGEEPSEGNGSPEPDKPDPSGGGSYGSDAAGEPQKEGPKDEKRSGRGNVDTTPGDEW